MADRLLVVNAGSSSLKLTLLDGDTTVRATTVERWSGADDLEPLEVFLRDTEDVGVVAHRVVHGGPGRTGAVRIDDEVVQDLRRLTDLAPLHQPRSLAGIEAVGAVLPDVPATACFDTSFHHTLPAAAATYALPAPWQRRWSPRRFGFHGLSHAYAARRAAQEVGQPLAGLRVVTCHLGSGASLCAVRGGCSVDTTMGLTPLAGLVMRTRSGDVDPGLLLWLQRQGLTLDELEDGLQHRSGLAGLSGTSGDLRDVLSAGTPEAALALDVMLHRLAREVAAMTAATGGLDLLVLTGGVGENSPEVRTALAGRLQHLGLAVDEPDDLHLATTGACETTAPGAAARTVVVAAREDLEMAAQVRDLLAGWGARS